MEYVEGLLQFVQFSSDPLQVVMKSYLSYRDSYVNFDEGLVETDYAFDAFYLLDIIFGFFRGFNRRAKVIKSKKEIFQNYLL